MRWRQQEVISAWICGLIFGVTDLSYDSYSLKFSSIFIVVMWPAANVDSKCVYRHLLDSPESEFLISTIHELMKSNTSM